MKKLVEIYNGIPCLKSSPEAFLCRAQSIYPPGEGIYFCVIERGGVRPPVFYVRF